MKLTSLKSRSPFTVLLNSSTLRIFVPASRSGWKMMPGYLRIEGLISSMLSCSSIFRREVVCFDLATLALNRWMNSSNSFFLLLGLLVLVPMLAQGELARFVPEAVIAREKVDVAVINIDRMRAHRIEEVAVVRDDQHRVFVIRQVILQPRDRRPVEVVGRPVEQQVVGFAEQACASSTRTFSLALKSRISWPCRASRTPRLLNRLAASLSAFQPCISANRSSSPRPETVLLRKVGLMYNASFFLHRLPQRLMPHQNRCRVDRKPVIGEVVLLSTDRRSPGPKGHVAPRGHLAAEHFEERGLPALLAPDHTVAAARGEF